MSNNVHKPLHKRCVGIYGISINLYRSQTRLQAFI